MIVTSDIPACKHYIKTHTCIQALHPNTHTCIHALQALHQRIHLHIITPTQDTFRSEYIMCMKALHQNTHMYAYTHYIRTHTCIHSLHQNMAPAHNHYIRIHVHTLITSTYMSNHYIRTHPHSSNRTTVQSFRLFTPNNIRCLQHTQEDKNHHHLLYLQNLGEMCTCNIKSQVISSDTNSIPQEEMQCCPRTFVRTPSLQCNPFTSPCSLLFLLSHHHVLFCFYFHFTMYCSVPMLINMYCSVSTFTSPCIVLCSITMYCSVSMFTSLCAVFVSTSTSPCIVLFLLGVVQEGASHNALSLFLQK